MQSKTDLSIIIITINTKDYLKTCLDSVKKAVTGLATEIIVVDNNSTDGTPQMIKSEYPWVKYYFRNKVYGFGANNNFGFQEASGRYVLFLNSDTKINDPNIFGEMVEWMDKHPEVGASTCALSNPDLKTLQGSGGSFPTLFRLFSWMTFVDDIPGLDKLINPYHPMHPQSPIANNETYFKKQHKQDWITAAFFLVKAKAYMQAGKFDEDYNAYVEEVDLCYRLFHKGWKIYYLPNWKIVHFGSASFGSENSLIFELRNIKLFYQKHYPKWQLPVLSFLIKLGIVLRIVVFGILNPRLSKIYVKAFKTV